MQKLNMLKINFKSSANENYLLNISINPFVPNTVFLYPLKTSENPTVF